MRDGGGGNGQRPLGIVREASPAGRVLITGGAGFVGANLAHRLLSSGREVTVFDNLSRAGVERNVEWLADSHPAGLEVVRGDVRDAHALAAEVARASEVFHFAAQVAVTTSLEDPVSDFEVNARGTLNLLEAARVLTAPPPIVFTSTNKVYGGLGRMELRLGNGRYEPVDAELRAHGVAEEMGLDFQSPYGCSKGAADQYVLDYARTLGLRAVVFRMSCIYGPRQFGTEDQGWIAHFLIRALEARPITLYGDGHQVRDVLFIDDLVDALLAAQTHMSALSGGAFNIGGGPGNAASLIEVIAAIDGLLGSAPAVMRGAWRPGDQRCYVSDTRRFQRATGWAPEVGVHEGLRRLHGWLCGQGTGRGARLSFAHEVR